jgi:hypothetical protein
MKTYLDIPAIWRTLNVTFPAWVRLNATIGLTVWRPRNISFYAK